jgi:hypothetical protein
MSIVDLVRELDRILLLKNTLVKPALTYSAIVEYISSLLRDCALYSKHYNLRLNTLTLLYSCNNNKTCIHVLIEPTPVSHEYDKIEVTYLIQGGKCEQ